MLNILIKNQENEIFGLFDDIEIMVMLRKEHRIYPVAIGNLPHSSQNKILGPPFLLNSFQLQYLFEIGLFHLDLEIVSDKYLIFKYFTQEKYFVKEGTKFGCDYLIYKGDPLYCHSEAMVVEASEVNVHKLVELCRIGNDTNKKVVFAYINSGKVEAKEIKWINTGAR